MSDLITVRRSPPPAQRMHAIRCERWLEVERIMRGRTCGMMGKSGKGKVEGQTRGGLPLLLVICYSHCFRTVALYRAWLVASC